MQSASRTSCSVVWAHYGLLHLVQSGEAQRRCTTHVLAVYHAYASCAPAYDVGDIVNYVLTGSLAWPPESSMPAYTKALQELG